LTYTPAAGTILGAGQGQVLMVTFSPADSADYTRASGATTINVLAASPMPTVTALGASPVKQKGKVTAIDVGFSGGLDLGSAQGAANYQLMMVVPAKRRRTPPRLVPVGLASAAYNRATQMVTLVPGGKLKSGSYQLLILSSPSGGVHDNAGQPLVGGTATLSFPA
jgi:hypothetical protein